MATDPLTLRIPEKRTRKPDPQRHLMGWKGDDIDRRVYKAKLECMTSHQVQIEIAMFLWDLVKGHPRRPAWRKKPEKS